MRWRLITSVGACHLETDPPAGIMVAGELTLILERLRQDTVEPRPANFHAYELAAVDYTIFGHDELYGQVVRFCGNRFVHLQFVCKSNLFSAK